MFGARGGQFNSEGKAVKLAADFSNQRRVMLSRFGARFEKGGRCGEVERRHLELMLSPHIQAPTACDEELARGCMDDC